MVFYNRNTLTPMVFYNRNTLGPMVFCNRNTLTPMVFYNRNTLAPKVFCNRNTLTPMVFYNRNTLTTMRYRALQARSKVPPLQNQLSLGVPGEATSMPAQVSSPTTSTIHFGDRVQTDGPWGR
ncbi:hypothetical protein Anas_05343 [Armadillidium nasatum]|uniref:Uncharacterized protein n=1 Tax=Armadillidium nasatum TaxID=96803 RepID=A0A5N5SWI8_9CRUS|nr:hypothetical protein Anas_05343 [Armadillidium nasatum]